MTEKVNRLTLSLLILALLSLNGAIVLGSACAE